MFLKKKKNQNNNLNLVSKVFLLENEANKGKAKFYPKNKDLHHFSHLGNVKSFVTRRSTQSPGPGSSKPRLT